MVCFRQLSRGHDGYGDMVFDNCAAGYWITERYLSSYRSLETAEIAETIAFGAPSALTAGFADPCKWDLVSHPSSRLFFGPYNRSELRVCNRHAHVPERC
mmetsp:Transcript_82768/g.146169  ORF Transcript_82768/g.146169 Transcript_82768/m.146169 type:complete len:100 (-) Transcript_82768:752-1051(-)